jgi:hypothetical protein
VSSIGATVTQHVRKQQATRRLKMSEEIMGIRDITKMVGCSPALIYLALQTGELAGRNLGGRKGWISTRTSVLDWVENGNVEDGGGENGN